MIYLISDYHLNKTYNNLMLIKMSSFDKYLLLIIIYLMY